MFRITTSAIALSLLGASSWADTERYILIVNNSCSVVEGKPRLGERVIAGPFASRDEAIKAMRQQPACQNRD